jgi:hypothetical protein
VAVVVTAPPGVVTHRFPCFGIALSASVDDIMSVTILGLPARVMDPLPGRRSALVGRLPCCAPCVNGRFWALSTAVVPRATLMAYAGRRALGLFHGHLLDERLRLAMQVSRLGHRRRGHGPE